ncbi:hypothetical protein AZI87_17855 [Bdellovibrio bacteriovorus]|uniref:Uncharacterized protein n=1 Tax=Bdellovibrio bacteriovorus TaxID=959 RepID=A0A162FTR0_BDEBC|nr:hypothetical protein AZI87_17855 [Bdellovibrio bacteriovorus]
MLGIDNPQKDLTRKHKKMINRSLILSQFEQSFVIVFHQEIQRHRDLFSLCRFEIKGFERGNL